MNNIKLILLYLLAVGFAGCSGGSSKPSETAVVDIVEAAPAELSLYDRLGGADGISVLVDDIITTHLENPVVSPQFDYLRDNPEQLELVKQHTREFLGAGTGGPEQYTGGDVPSVHAGMNISNAEFLGAIDDILLVLNQHEASEQTKKDMLYILYSFKDQVVGK